MLKRNRKRGQSIVEMSLLFPLFLLVVVGGIVDFGFAFYNALALQQLVNDASLTAAEKHFNDAQVRNYISQYNSPPVGWNQPNIYSATISNIPMRDGSIMKNVEIEYHSKTYTPFYQTALNAVTGGDYLTLRANAAYKIPNTVINR